MNNIIKYRSLWCQAFNTNNVEHLLQLYHKTHTFKGTFRDRHTYNYHYTHMYFNQLFTQNEKVKVTFLNSYVVRHNDVFIDSGKYRFTINNKKTDADYQFVYIYNDKIPLIISHTSYSCK